MPTVPISGFHKAFQLPLDHAGAAQPPVPLEVSFYKVVDQAGNVWGPRAGAVLPPSGPLGASVLATAELEVLGELVRLDDGVAHRERAALGVLVPAAQGFKIFAAIRPVEQHEALGTCAGDPHPEPGGSLLALKGGAAEIVHFVACSRYRQPGHFLLADRMRHPCLRCVVAVGAQNMLKTVAGPLERKTASLRQSGKALCGQFGQIGAYSSYNDLQGKYRMIQQKCSDNRAILVPTAGMIGDINDLEKPPKFDC